MKRLEGRLGARLLERTTRVVAPTLDGLGVPGDGAHAAHEHVRLDVWPRHVQLLAELIRDPGV